MLNFYNNDPSFLLKVQFKVLMKDLALLLDLFGNSEETKLLICTAIFVWCLQRQRNGGLNSGQKSAIIVTDAFLVMYTKISQKSREFPHFECTIY